MKNLKDVESILEDYEKSNSFIDRGDLYYVALTYKKLYDEAELVLRIISQSDGSGHNDNIYRAKDFLNK